jgi:hypothetical protein
VGFPYIDLVEKTLKISPDIRFATICNMLGEVKYSQHRKNAKNLLTHRESIKSIESATRAWSVRNEFAAKIGKGEFAIAQYGKIARITVPMGKDHLLYMTTSKNADHSKIAKKASKLKLGRIRKPTKAQEKLFTP